MDDKTFFAESIMFMFKQTMGLVEGTVTNEEFNQSKMLVDTHW